MLPSYYEVIRDLPDGERLQIYDAIMDYGFGNEVGDLPPILKGYMSLITPSLDKSIRFEEKQVVNGGKGGRPKKNPNETQTKPKQNPNETQTKASENLAIAVAVANDVAVDSAIDNAFEGKTRPRIKKYGVYGWIRLSDEQYKTLLADLGQSELDRCIQYIDESAQQNGNKNRWKDWNLVIRRCSRERWGLKQAETAHNWKEGAVRGWSGDV